MSVNHIYAVALSKPASTTTPTWAIPVQPKKTKRLFFHESLHTVVFSGSNTGTSARQLDGEELLVKMLIGENETVNIEKKVSESLQSVVKTQRSEVWLNDSVSALQHANLIKHFNVDQFMQMATTTLNSQQQHHETVAVEVDYMGELGRTKSVEEMHQTRDEAMKKGKKTSHHGFWISRPQGVPREATRRNSWERQDDAYGGLM